MREVPDMAQITCRYCGTIVETSRARLRCDSEECRKRYFREAMAATRERRINAREPKACRECGVVFGTVADVGNKQYCSPECLRARNLRRRRDTEYTPAVRTCDFCAGEIPYKSGKRRYCSTECQKAGIAREARWRVKGLDPSKPLSDICELCGATDRRLVIDHDHSCCPRNYACGKCFRGMLCQPCNVALGMFQDDPALLRRAAEYLVSRAAIPSA